MKTSTMKPFETGDIFLGCTYLTNPDDDHMGEVGMPHIARQRALEGSDAIERVIEVSLANGIFPGIHTDSADRAKFWAAKGMKMIGFCTDIKLIQRVCKASVQELHTGTFKT